MDKKSIKCPENNRNVYFYDNWKTPSAEEDYVTWSEAQEKLGRVDIVRLVL